jgi:hypothetical protein
MGPGAKAAIALGAVALIGGAAVYALSQTKGGKFLLQTTAGPGGTINPNSASGIYEPAGSVVPITITAASGYTIGQVLEDGSPINSSTTDTVETYQITMNQNHSIDVVFYQGGQPPVGAPYSINSPGSTIVTGYYACTVTVAALVISKTTIQPSDQNWNTSNVTEFPVTFKVIDANGNGVPGVTVTLYPNLFPDYSKYQGYLALNDQMISKNNPLTLKTDSNGNVTVNASYYYGLNDHLLTLSQDANLIVTVFPYMNWHPEDGNNPGYLGDIYQGKSGDQIVPASPILNQIICVIPGTAIPAAQANIYCQFHAHMK